MSLVGIFRARDGITALVDSKASCSFAEGSLEESVTRKAEKLFVFPNGNGVAVVCGALQVFTKGGGTIFEKSNQIEDLIRDYLNKHAALDSVFFQELLLKMNTSTLNKEPIYFIVGRKIWAGKYQIEYHKVGYDYYAMKIGNEKDCCFVGGCELYTEPFKHLDYSNKTDSVAALQKFTAAKLQEMIDFFDQTLKYNPVGGTVKSFILK